MAASQPPLTLIVAATVKNGIGKNGGLPWPMLKKEMAYFARVTKRTPQQHTVQGVPQERSTKDQNVVIMGRKTWDSIPPKFRPLKDRTNVIISSKSSEAFGTAHDDVIVAQDIETGIRSLQVRIQEGKARPMGKVFVIGGSSIYDAALKLPQANRILLTRIQNHYDCDTSFPVDLESEEAQKSGWSCRSQHELQECIGEELGQVDMEEVAGDVTVQYKFQLYEKR